MNRLAAVWHVLPDEYRRVAALVGLLAVFALGAEATFSLLQTGYISVRPAGVFGRFISAAAVLTYALVAVVLAAYTRGIAAFISHAGLADYRRWILVRDLRIWVVLLALGVLAWSRFPWWGYLVAIHYFLNLAKSVSPPNLLILHTFDTANYLFADSLAFSIPGVNVVSLFPHRLERGRNFWRLNTAMAGVGARVSSDRQWKRMVRKYIDWSDLVVVDLSNPRAGLLTELDFIAEREALDKALLYIEGDRSLRRDTLPVQEAARSLKDHQALQKCARRYPDHLVHTYPAAVTQDAPVRVMLVEPGAWAERIRSALHVRLAGKPWLRALADDRVPFVGLRIPVFSWFTFIKYLTFVALAVGLASGLPGTSAARDPGSSVAQPPSTAAYRMTDLGTLGGDWSVAYDINNRGQVVGGSAIATGDSRAFLWTRGQGMRDLGTLGGDSSVGTAVNASGHVAGVSKTDTGVPHAFLWTPDQGMVDLGTLGGAASAASDINDRGQVVGWADLPLPPGAQTDCVERRSAAECLEHAALWTGRDQVVDVGGAIPGPSRALAVDGQGRVTGWVRPGSGASAGVSPEHAFLWSPDRGLVDLGTLGGPWSRGHGCNDRGVVVGSGNLEGEERTHALMWVERLGFLDLGTMEGADTEALDINAAGLIAGRPAFVWTNRTGFVRLPTPGGEAAALAVNDSGHVAGFSLASESGHRRAVVWTR